MLTYGFFNSLNGDRTYNADQISSMFEGLLSDGVFNNVDSAFEVKAGSGLKVTVGSGRAWLQDKWVRNPAIVEVSLSAASVTLSRYTAIVLRKSVEDRTITIETIDGEAAASPTRPSIVRNGDIYDLCLAYVLVRPNATGILQADITDARADTTVCGWVTGIVEQVDTSTLFAQWESAYSEAIEDMADAKDELVSDSQTWMQEFEDDMEAWEGQQQSSFEAWFAALTEELNVNTYVDDYWKTANFTSGTTHTVTLDMAGYTYDSDDIITVWINGLISEAETDYTIDTSGAAPVLTFTQFSAPNENEPYKVTVQVIKSRIGFSS